MATTGTTNSSTNSTLDDTSQKTFCDTQINGKIPGKIRQEDPPPDDTSTHHSSMQSHINSLPLWHRRLLFEYKQIANDVEVWRAFRSRQRLTIASDGSLREEAGTFGWKLTTRNHHVLFQGYGPVDGPIEIGSSTRSELGGFTAPLLLVTVLARHWGLRHRCKFRWLADSEVAINRVTFVTRKDYSPTKQPDNSDYLTTITELFRELRRPMLTKWIKSHQDGKISYDKLTPDARLNVDVDELATNVTKTKKRNHGERRIISRQCR
ncbi:hypothetical protein MHU86_4796 [Fragilaria crotonensis]|nr:hypothetical protein MHU86_4796 [Fragilaria crotonensis]